MRPNSVSQGSFKLQKDLNALLLGEAVRYPKLAAWFFNSASQISCFSYKPVFCPAPWMLCTFWLQIHCILDHSLFLTLYDLFLSDFNLPVFLTPCYNSNLYKLWLIIISLVALILTYYNYYIVILLLLSSIFWW